MGTETRSFVYVKRIFLVIAALFLLRLAFLQVFVHGEYTANATEVRTIQYTTAPHRGTIYDRNGTVLAVSVDATTVYANPTEVTNVQYEARKLADVLGGEESEYAELLRTPDTPFVYVKRQADVDVAERVKQLQLDGIYFLEESRREYPNASIGGNVIGACDVDGNGICGLELQYDENAASTARRSPAACIWTSRPSMARTSSSPSTSRCRTLSSAPSRRASRSTTSRATARRW